MLVVITCHKPADNWGTFDEKTIERNLASLDSASAVYLAQVTAGHRDSAAIQAAALLLEQPGIDSVAIAPDSTVWVLFTNELRVGLGDLPADSETRAPAKSRPEAPETRISSGQPGGEVYPIATLIVPFTDELPASWNAAEVIRREIESVPGMLYTQTFRDSETSVERIRALLGESPVFVWTGHGLLVRGIGGHAWTPGLVTGKAFARAEMSRAAGDEYRAYLKPTPPQLPQAAVYLKAGPAGPRYYMILLPEFIRAWGRFGSWNAPTNGNFTKTIVYLSTCYSAFNSVPGTPPLIQGFLDAGADLVLGWSWAVHDKFAADKDTTFFEYLCRRYLPEQAVRKMGTLVDPRPISGGQAGFRLFGDSQVMMYADLEMTRNGTHRYAKDVFVDTVLGGGTRVGGTVVDANGQRIADLSIFFPGRSPGMWSPTYGDGGIIDWTDAATDRTYTVRESYRNLDSELDITRWSYNAVVGTFYAKLGWWNPDADPILDPPDDSIRLDAGFIGFTGRMGACTLAVAGPTYHWGTITGCDTWSPDGNPHIIDNDLGVAAGASLTILPGCEVLLDSSVEIGVDSGGTLQAVGAAGSPIIFTANSDNPVPGEWGAIRIEEDAAVARFSYCTFEYGGYELSNPVGEVIIGPTTAPEFNNCVIRQSAGWGIECNEGGFSSFNNNQVQENRYYPMFIDAAMIPTIGTGNIFGSNDSNGLVVGLVGDIESNLTWPNFGTPYVLRAVIRLNASSRPVLTIASGCELRACRGGGFDIEQGALVADGTGGRIVFKSAGDPPQPEDFSGIYFGAGTGSSSRLVRCDIEYGGAANGLPPNAGSIHVVNCRPTITNCDIGHSFYWGIFLYGDSVPDTTALKQNNTFHDNSLGNVVWWR